MNEPRYRLAKAALKSGMGFVVELIDEPDCRATGRTVEEALAVAVRVRDRRRGCQGLSLPQAYTGT